MAIEAGRDRPFGFSAFNIVAADTLIDGSTETTVREHASAIEIRVALSGTSGAYAISKAKRMLGWEPLHSWRDDTNESSVPPE